MSHIDRSGEFARKLDDIDSRIADLVVERNRLCESPDVPTDYDCDGEGEVYFKKLPSAQAEAVYHAIIERQD